MSRKLICTTLFCSLPSFTPSPFMSVFINFLFKQVVTTARISHFKKMLIARPLPSVVLKHNVLIPPPPDWVSYIPNCPQTLYM